MAILTNEIDTWKNIASLDEFVILLDSRVHNEHIRAFAVKKLENMSDNDL